VQTVGTGEVVGGRNERAVAPIDRKLLDMDESTSNERSATTDGNALPNRDPPDVTRFKAAAAKRVQAHRARARIGLRCVTVRVSSTVRHLISTGYLSLESSGETSAVAIGLEAWIYDNIPWMLSRRRRL
jgi:hypothetical protein